MLQVYNSLQGTSYYYPIGCQVWLIKILKIKISTLYFNSNLNKFFIIYKNSPKIQKTPQKHHYFLTPFEHHQTAKNHQNGDKTPKVGTLGIIALKARCTFARFLL
jgi:hypothetical protein